MTRHTCTIKEAASVLGVGVQTLYDHLSDVGIELGGSNDVIRVIRIGQRVLIPVAELERVLGGSIQAAS